jgi:hypothetical protein
MHPTTHSDGASAKLEREWEGKETYNYSLVFNTSHLKSVGF